MNEIENYLIEFVCVSFDSQNVDIFDIWRNLQISYSTLTQMIKNVLTISVSNVEIERLFFMTRNVVHYRRFRLIFSIIENVMILKKSYQIIEKFDNLVFEISLKKKISMTHRRSKTRNELTTSIRNAMKMKRRCIMKMMITSLFRSMCRLSLLLMTRFRFLPFLSPRYIIRDRMWMLGLV